MMGDYSTAPPGGVYCSRGLQEEPFTPLLASLQWNEELVFTTGNQIGPPLPNSAVPNQGKRGNRSPRAPKSEPYPFPVFPKGKLPPSPSRRSVTYTPVLALAPSTRAPPLPVSTRPLDLLLHRRGTPAHPVRPIMGRTRPLDTPKRRAARVAATFPARPLPQLGLKPAPNASAERQTPSANTWAFPSLSAHRYM